MDAGRVRNAAAGVLLLAAVGSGCHGVGPRHNMPVPPDVPRELVKVSLPEYRVEPPDVLVIEAVRTVPKPPYKAEPLDVLVVQLADPIPMKPPLSGPVTVEADGTIQLGPDYGGSVRVVGKTIAEIKTAVEKHLTDAVKLKAPVVTVSLAQARAAQRISGPHLVTQDGTISLGTYGSVRVAGMTLAEVRQAVEAVLSATLLDPEVSVTVQGFNSKLLYVIQDGGGAGQTVTRLPVTGNDTVLDAVAQVSGLSAVSSKDRIWVSRPAPAGCVCQILPVDWRGITECADTTTNYQLMPGDRVFVAAYPMVQTDIVLGRVIAPVERLFGITLLGNSTVRGFRNQQNGVNNNGFGGGF